MKSSDNVNFKNKDRNIGIIVKGDERHQNTHVILIKLLTSTLRGPWLVAGRTVRQVSFKRLYHWQAFSSSQKKHKPIMRLWSRMKLFLRKIGIQGPGISADLSLQSTILPGTLARMASSRCWCAWEPGTAASQPRAHSSQLWRWC